MSVKQPISDEYLNAFIDGQLGADENSSILDAVNEDQELSRRVCELKQVQQMVQCAYEHLPARSPRAKINRRSSHVWIQSIAAGLILALGALFGWVGNGMQKTAPQLQAMYIDSEKAFQHSSLANIDELRAYNKLLLHINSADPVKIKLALDTAEKLLDIPGKKVELAIVANASGLDLLRADVSPYAERILALQARFDTLTFMACRTAMDRLKREQHIEVNLLPGILTTPNALDEILTRLRQGWVYISV